MFVCDFHSLSRLDILAQLITRVDTVRPTYMFFTVQLKEKLLKCPFLNKKSHEINNNKKNQGTAASSQ